MDGWVNREKLYALVIASCVSYGVPKVIDLLSDPWARAPLLHSRIRGFGAGYTAGYDRAEAGIRQ